MKRLPASCHCPDPSCTAPEETEMEYARQALRLVEERDVACGLVKQLLESSLGLTADTIDVMAGLIVERDAKDAEIAELRAIVHEETLWLTEYHTRPLPGSDETCPACLLVSRAATALARHAPDGLAPIPPSDRRGEGK